MNSSMYTNEPRGLSCPRCKNLIQFRIEDLLRRTSFRCSGCALELTLDRRQSREALQALEKLQVAIETLNAVKKKYGAQT